VVDGWETEEEETTGALSSMQKPPSGKIAAQETMRHACPRHGGQGRWDGMLLRFFGKASRKMRS
jgi:hypothetical protein